MQVALDTSVNLNLTWVQQINSYYCELATAYMLLRNLGYTPTQNALAGNDYLRTDKHGETPWFSGATEEHQNQIYYFGSVPTNG